MATPHIVGVVSLLQSLSPDITSNQIKSLFRSAAILVKTEDSKPIAASISLEKIISQLSS